MSPGATLPPSTGNFRGSNVEIMERGYTFIASSISDLERHNFVRGFNVINNGTIFLIHARRECEQVYGEPRFMEAYDQKLSIYKMKEDKNNYLDRKCFPN